MRRRIPPYARRKRSPEAVIPCASQQFIAAMHTRDPDASRNAPASSRNRGAGRMPGAASSSIALQRPHTPPPPRRYPPDARRVKLRSPVAAASRRLSLVRSRGRGRARRSRSPRSTGQTGAEEGPSGSTARRHPGRARRRGDKRLDRMFVSPMRRPVSTYATIEGCAAWAQSLTHRRRARDKCDVCRFGRP